MRAPRLAAAMLLAATWPMLPGCRPAPNATLVATRALASLTVSVDRNAGYRAQYLVRTDWDLAEAEAEHDGQVVATGTAPAVVDPATNRREAVVRLDGLDPDGTYRVTIRLKRLDAAGAQVLATETREGLQFLPGPNQVAMGLALTWQNRAEVTVGQPALEGAHVRSIPIQGPPPLFSTPYDVAFDAAGRIYVADRDNHAIRRVEPDESGRMVVTTLAGTGRAGFRDGAGATAEFSSPRGLTLDAQGAIYVADSDNHRIRKLVEADGRLTVSTLAGTGEAGAANGPGATATLEQPFDLAFGPSGDLYVTEYGGHRVRRLALAPDGSATAFALAGSGTAGYQEGAGTTARFNRPIGVAVDAAEAVYVADSVNHRIRKIVTDALGNVTVSPAAGGATPGFADGSATLARFNRPFGLTIDAGGNLFVADRDNQRIRKLAAGTMAVSTMAGWATPGFQNGYYTSARFHMPVGLAADPAGQLAVADSFNHRVRYLTQSGLRYNAGTRAGTDATGFQDGQENPRPLSRPYGVAIVDADTAYVSDAATHRIHRLKRGSTGLWVLSVLAGTGAPGFGDGAGAWAAFNQPAALAADGDGNLYVADYGNHRIRKIAIDASGAATVSTLAGQSNQGFGNGAATSATFSFPFGLAVDDQDNVYVADSNNHAIRKITPGGTVSTLAGDGTPGQGEGAGPAARFNRPLGLAVDASGTVYVADTDNHRIRAITPGGTVSTLAGDGTPAYLDGAAARFSRPVALAIDGAQLLVSDADNACVRAIALATGATGTLAGGPTSGYADGPAPNARFGLPFGLAVGPDGHVAVADATAGWVRQIVR